MYIINTSNNSTDNTVKYDYITVSSNTTDSQSNTSNGGNSSNSANNGFLIAIEVIFSVLVLFILLFCFFAGVKRKKRLRRLNENMIENAINQQERRIQLHLQGQTHSSSTVTTLIQLPPPSYSPPDPTNQLSNDTVSRLDHLLLENHLCTLQQQQNSNTTTRAAPITTLPKYSDLYNEGVNRSD